MYSPRPVLFLQNTFLLHSTICAFLWPFHSDAGLIWACRWNKPSGSLAHPQHLTAPFQVDNATQQLIPCHDLPDQSAPRRSTPSGQAALLDAAHRRYDFFRGEHERGPEGNGFLPQGAHYRPVGRQKLVMLQIVERRARCRSPPLGMQRRPACAAAPPVVAATGRVVTLTPGTDTERLLGLTIRA